MAKEKAAMFIDNSNIFLGMQSYSRYLYKNGKLKKGQYLRMNWLKLIEFLEKQNGGVDVYARHFFCSLPPAADINQLRHRPTEEEWEKLVKSSSQSGFYKVIQNPPFNFRLHGIGLRLADVLCRIRIKQAYRKCLNAQDGNIKCSLRLNLDECYKCEKHFLFKYEKGVDVALATELLLFGTVKGANLDRIILVAGDGDYKEAARHIRNEVGKDFQIVSWKKALSRDLSKIGNQPTIILDDHWEELCEIRTRPPLEEAPAGAVIDDADDATDLGDEEVVLVKQ